MKREVRRRENKKERKLHKEIKAKLRRERLGTETYISLK
jgi:hypothetical protein